MAAPGSGAGSSAAAAALLKAVVPLLYKLQAAFPFGSKENNAVSRAINALGPVAGKTEDSLVPSAIQQMALAAKQGGALNNAPPIGIKPAAPPSGAQPEGE